jgi:hypothetical protein
MFPPGQFRSDPHDRELLDGIRGKPNVFADCSVEDIDASVNADGSDIRQTLDFVE